MRIVRWLLLALGFLIGSAFGQAARSAPPVENPVADPRQVEVEAARGTSSGVEYRFDRVIDTSRPRTWRMSSFVAGD